MAEIAKANDDEACLTVEHWPMNSFPIVEWKIWSASLGRHFCGHSGSIVLEAYRDVIERIEPEARREHHDGTEDVGDCEVSL